MWPDFASSEFGAIAAIGKRSSRPAGEIRKVRHYVAGGLESGGGIGRMVGYIVEAARLEGDCHAVIDTRGPRWFPPRSILKLVSAAAVMCGDRLTDRATIHHIHLAGRGSTSRKQILAGLALSLGCRYVLHLHDYDYAADFANRSCLQQWLIRRMFRNADHVIVLGRRDRDTLTRIIGVEDGRISIAHNCVPEPLADEIAAETVPLILFLGRLSDRKGVPELLKALASPVMANLQWAAVLAGDGPVEAYRQCASMFRLDDRVSMPGWLDAAQTAKLRARARILVLPSHAEGLAMAVVEGMASGLAVVTTRVGAHDEIITDGETGLFVPVGDVDALADALSRLVRDPELCRHLSTNARIQYRCRHSMKAYMHRLRDLYRSVDRQNSASVRPS